jgi:hypothetical protein
MLKRFSTTLRAGALAALFVVGTSAAASAAPIVQFSTNGTFTGGDLITLGGAQITFLDAEGDAAQLTFFGSFYTQDAPSNTNYGDITMETIGEYNGTANATFTLGIIQTAPTGGTSSLPATITGTLAKTDQTNFQLQFSASSTTIDGVTYEIQPFYFIVPPNSGVGGESGPGVTTLQGRLVAAEQPTVIPEPATMMLLGTGLIAAFRARRRLTNNEQQ